MFKLMNNSTNTKAFAQQRATPRQTNNVATYEDNEPQGVDTELGEESVMDDSSSCYSGLMTAAVAQHDSRNQTMLLAQFLSTTGPEEFATKQDVDLETDSKKQQQFKRASRLLNRLRKGPNMSVLRSAAVTTSNIAHDNSEKKLNYIPLPVYDYQNADVPYSHQQRQTKESTNKVHSTTTTTTTVAAAAAAASNSTANANATTTATATATTTPHQINKIKRESQQQYFNALRDSGIYSETNSEKDATVTPSDLPPFTTVMNELQFPHPPYSNSFQLQQQHNRHRPAPLPPAAAATTAATSVCSSDGGTSTDIRSVPEAALKRRSVRLRHVQVQTTNHDDNEMHMSSATKRTSSTECQTCPHCRQSITLTSSLVRRPSCPPALSSGRPLVAAKDTEDDAKGLLDMIMNLKSQLEEEKQCRLKLEKAIHQRQLDERMEEKERWASACLWLNNRIALLPE